MASFNVPILDYENEQERRSNGRGGCKCKGRCFRRMCPCMVDGRKCNNDTCDCNDTCCRGGSLLASVRAAVQVQPGASVGDVAQPMEVDRGPIQEAAEAAAVQPTGVPEPRAPRFLPCTEEWSQLPENMDQRVREIMEMTQRMRPRQLAEFFGQLPDYVVEPLHEAMVDHMRTQDAVFETELNDNPAWCICRRCVATGVPFEDECCGQNPCVTTDPFFVQNITNPAALQMQMAARNDVIATQDTGSTNKQYRYYGYVEFILWQYGFLGEGNRVPCGSCVYRIIRELFPNPEGVPYTHFKNKNDFQRMVYRTQ